LADLPPAVRIEMIGPGGGGLGDGKGLEQWPFVTGTGNGGNARLEQGLDCFQFSPLGGN
jgi:hypothetical protein